MRTFKTTWALLLYDYMHQIFANHD